MRRINQVKNLKRKEQLGSSPRKSFLATLTAEAVLKQQAELLLVFQVLQFGHLSVERFCRSQLFVICKRQEQEARRGGQHERNLGIRHETYNSTILYYS